MGPDAYRAAGLKAVIEELGFTVLDQGNLAPRSSDQPHLIGPV